MPDSKDNSRCTPLHKATRTGQTNVAIYLLNNNAAVDRVDHDKNKSLQYAIARKDVQIAKLLSDGDADIKLKDHLGRTPLD